MVVALCPSALQSEKLCPSAEQTITPGLHEVGQLVLVDEEGSTTIWPLVHKVPAATEPIFTQAPLEHTEKECPSEEHCIVLAVHAPVPVSEDGFEAEGEDGRVEVVTAEVGMSEPTSSLDVGMSEPTSLDEDDELEADDTSLLFAPLPSEDAPELADKVT